MPDHITIAVTTGDRIVAQQLALLAQLGIEPHDDLTKSRKLVFTTSREDVSLLLLRGSDVATYVEHGILIWAWRARMSCWSTVSRVTTSHLI